MLNSMATIEENLTDSNKSPTENEERQHNDRNTVKKTPKMELSKSDLLKLLGYLEGELQARDVVIATLKCEQIKSMLRERETENIIKDPLAALQRDGFATHEANNDILSYQQLGSLENLILQQRKTQLRIANVLKDNQTMHRKILDQERLKKQHLQNEIKKLNSILEGEKLKHKGLVVYLLEENKNTASKYIAERKRSEDLGQLLREEKFKSDTMAEGLEEESKKSLQMEADLEKHLALFDVERKSMMAALSSEQNKTKTLEAELAKCRSEIVSLEKELSEALQNNLLELSSRSSVGRMGSNDPIMSSFTKVIQPINTANSVPVSGPMTGIARSVNPGQSLRCTNPISGQIVNNTQIDKGNEECRSPMDTVKNKPVAYGRNMQSIDSSSSGIVKKTLFGIQRNMSVPNTNEGNFPGLIKKHSTAVGRGTPPPVPPNKPIIPPKKDLVSFMKKTSIAENTISTAEKQEQKDSLLKNNISSNDTPTIDKQEELVNN
ncbi:Hypothetical protein CINCED_3A015055 [Cinara cedri]|uniref:Cortactin-binding protein-2 N-terminal domain-containing protein n=1 Tax=Cinara cedri TaxID=506608 RepID=A0A5E4MVB3_9HEMI|nr:Hypothetical protein CINCED_3A015055 [Cinara cedri]